MFVFFFFKLSSVIVGGILYTTCFKHHSIRGSVYIAKHARPQLHLRFSDYHEWKATSAMDYHLKTCNKATISIRAFW